MIEKETAEKKKTQHHQLTHLALRWQNYFFRQRFHDAYAAMNRDYGFDIATQSQKNFNRLLLTLRENPHLPEEEKTIYQGCLLKDKEISLFDTWQTAIIPLFCLNHKSNLNFDKLIPLNKRESMGEAIDNAHTFGKGALREFSYFTLSLGSNQPLPNFLNEVEETVTIPIGQLSLNEARDFRGLWIGNHLSQFNSSEELCPYLYGTTKREVSFLKDGLKKIYRYHRDDGRIIERIVTFRDEVFAANKNLHTLFEALFYLFILELRLIGGEFQAYFWEHPDDSKAIIATFNALFPTYIFPEAKLASVLSLKKPYVQISKQTLEHKKLLYQWFEAAQAGKQDELLDCHAKGVNLNQPDHDLNTGLMLAIEHASPFNCTSAVIDWFLEQGACVSTKNKFGQDALLIAIRAGNLMVVKLLLTTGSSHLIRPTLRQYPRMRAFPHQPNALEYAIACKQLVIAYYLLEKMMTNPMPQKETYILNACKHLGGEERLEFIKALIVKGADVNASDSAGKTAMLLATQKDDADCLRLLLQHGAEPRAYDKHGESALHIAAYNGQIEIIHILAGHNIDLDHKNKKGKTAYAEITDILLGGYDAYINREEIKVEIKRDYRIELLYYAQEKESEVASRLETKYKEKWSNYSKKLAEVQELLLSLGASTVITTDQIDEDYQQYLCCAGMVTARVADEIYVLFMRKRNSKTLKADGYYLLPGGYKDLDDSDFDEAARREIQEETGLELENRIPSINIFNYEQSDISSKSYFRTQFFHYDLGELNTLPIAIPSSDAACAEFINLKDILSNKMEDGTVWYSYRGIRLSQSNACLILSTLHLENHSSSEITSCLHAESAFGKVQALEAISAGDRSTIIKLYQQGLDFNCFESLEYACENNNKFMVDLLIDLGVNVNHERRLALGGATWPLAVLITRQHNTLAKYLIEHHQANINLTVNGHHALLLAYKHNPEMFSYLFELTELSSEIAGSLLMACALKEDISLAKQILDLCKLNLNQSYLAESIFGYEKISPISYALTLKRWEFVHLFLEYGIDLELQEKGQTIVDRFYHYFQLARTMRSSLSHDNDYIIQPRLVLIDLFNTTDPKLIEQRYQKYLETACVFVRIAEQTNLESKIVDKLKEMISEESYCSKLSNAL